MNENDLEDCGNPSCGCTCQPNEDYCSENCKIAGALPDAPCQCGHPGCASGPIS